MPRVLFILGLSLLLSGYGSSLALKAQNLELLGNYRIAVLSEADAPATIQGIYNGLRIARGELQQRYTIEIQLDRVVLPKDPADISALKALLDSRPDAIIVALPESGLSAKWHSVLSDTEVALIVIGNDSIGNEGNKKLLIDENSIGLLAAKHLLQVMQRSGTIAVVATDESIANQARLEGALATLGNRQPHRILKSTPNPHAIHTLLRETVAEDRNRRIRAWLFLDDWAFRAVVDPIWDASRAPAVAIMSHPSTSAYLRSGKLAGVLMHPWQDWGVEALHRIIYKIHDRAGERESVTDFPPQWFPLSASTELESLWAAWLRE
jgi:DNA-binding LacI/PurR family transcriptional regulator